MATLYQDTAANTLRHSPLQGARHTEVLVIGGGFAGLGTALSLLEKGQREVLLLEAHDIGHGASGRNGGFVFGGFSLDNAELVRQCGRTSARQLYGLTLQALQTIRTRIAKHGIACDAVEGGALLADWFGDAPALRRMQRFMQAELQVDWQLLDAEQTQAHARTQRYHGALFEPQAFHFHPLKYAQALAGVLHHAGVGVHTQSAVQHIERNASGWRVRTAHAEVQARELVLACGGYIGALWPPLGRAVLPIATYVMATEPLGARLQAVLPSRAAVYDTRFAFDYYRALPDTRLLWGGRIAIRQRTAQDVARLLRADVLKVYPQLQGVQISHAWSGLMSYARHKMPQIGRSQDGLWYAMGFGGHGVAPTTAAGALLADAITGQAPIPSAFANYGLAPTYGALGLAAAQASYWWAQWRDALRQ